MSSSKTAIPGRQYMTSLMYPLPIRKLKQILQTILPNQTLLSTSELKSPQLARLYVLNMDDGGKLLLAFAPSLVVRLLRCEGNLMGDEAGVVRFISSYEEGEEVEMREGLEELKNMVPRLLKHSSNNREMAYPYSIFEEVNGVSLSEVAIYLNLKERLGIDHQVGVLARRLAELKSKDGRFGPVGKVIGAGVAGRGGEDGGCERWSEAFQGLLEGILRDGEDMAVLLPYEIVRERFRGLKWRLDAVTQARLVVLDIESEKNVLIERDLEDGDKTKVVGLRSWSQGIFGDPLIANCWEDPKEEFLKGWRETGEDVVEDAEGVGVRMLLYKCFRAVVGIVTEHYRPQSDSSGRELDGRRSLTNALAELEKIDVVVGDTDSLKRQRSRSCEDLGLAKKQRVEE